MEHAQHATSVLHSLASRLGRVLTGEGVALFDLHIEAPMAGSQHANIDGVLAALGFEAEGLSRVIEEAGATAWKHTATLDGRKLTALELLEGPLHDADHHLHEFEVVLERAPRVEMRTEGNGGTPSHDDHWTTLLAVYAIGTVDGAEEAALEDHLDRCASCRRQLVDLQAAAVSIISPEALPLTLWEHIAKLCERRKAYGFAGSPPTG